MARENDQAAGVLRAMRDGDTAIQQLSEAKNQAEAQLRSILLSRSWRWTRPLRWIKIKFYELVLRKTIGREVSLVRSRGPDCLQKQLVSANRPASAKKHFKKTSDTIVVIAHEASRTGAPILAWNLVKKLQHRYNVVVLLRAGGSLFFRVRRRSRSSRKPPQGMESAPAGVQAFVEGLISRYRPKYAIANSVEARVFVPAFKEAGVFVIALVHEFAEYTKPAGTLNQLYLTASGVVFPDDIVAKSSIAEYPFLDLRDIVVIPQGECEIPPQAIDELECTGDRYRKLVDKI
jgi:hypothetical protein